MNEGLVPSQWKCPSTCHGEWFVRLIVMPVTKPWEGGGWSLKNVQLYINRNVCIFVKAHTMIA